MGQFGGFYKGEKKKKKKGGEIPGSAFSPVFIPPKIIGKGKKTTE